MLGTPLLSVEISPTIPGNQRVPRACQDPPKKGNYDSVRDPTSSTGSNPVREGRRRGRQVRNPGKGQGPRLGGPISAREGRPRGRWERNPGRGLGPRL